MQRGRSKLARTSARTSVGFWLIVMGALFLLDQSTSIDVWSLITGWWPLILVYIGITSLVRGSKVKGSLFLLAGALLQARQLGYLPGSVLSAGWPLLIILAGLWLVFFRGGPHTVRSDPHAAHETLNVVTIFGGTKEVVNSQAFRGGQAFVLFGDVDIDLRDVKFATERPVIEATVIFGEMNIIVPRDCKVDFKPVTVLGEAKQDVLPSSNESAQVTTIYVHGLVTFGALKVRS